MVDRFCVSELVDDLKWPSFQSRPKAEHSESGQKPSNWLHIWFNETSFLPSDEFVSHLVLLRLLLPHYLVINYHGDSVMGLLQRKRF